MKTLRRALQLFVAAAMLSLFALPSLAASCTCGESTKPHDASHNMEYTYNGASGHDRICYSCQLNGHTEDCAQVHIVSNEAHSFVTEGTGSNRKQRCTKCGYTSDAPCPHTNAKWVQHYAVSDDDISCSDTLCVKWCYDCRTVCETKSHDWGFRPSTREQHELRCKDCGYTKLAKENHTFTYKYTQMKRKSNPTKYDIENSMVVSASTTHQVHAVCSKCGDDFDYYEKHNFKKNKCTACGLKREIPSKVSGVRAAQIGTGKAKTQHHAAYWIWEGRRLVWHPASKATYYEYNAKISWKKKSKVYGYVYSVDKNGIKPGMSIIDAYGFTFTKKTSAKYRVSSAKRLSKAAIYVAPVSKSGFIGKATKVNIRLR